MAYATQAELTEIIGSRALLAIADRDGDGTADAALISSALTNASSFADTYLSAYTQAQRDASAQLKNAVIAIANELLRITDQSTEDSRRAHDRAVAWLRDVSANKAVLDGSSLEDEDDTDPGDPEVVANDRVWSRDTAGRLF